MGSGKTKVGFNERSVNGRIISALILFAAIGLALSACSSTEIAANGNSNGGSHSKTAVNQDAVKTPDVNQPLAAVNGQNVEVASQTNKILQRLEQLRADGANQKPSKAVVNTRPAPEDSFMSAQLTDVAREIRTWKKNPVLLRVEKSYSGDGSKVKIVLRDGRVFDVDGKEVANLDQISSVAILQLVGVQPPLPEGPKPSVRPDQTTVKKPAN